MHCKKILCVFCCLFALGLCACTAAKPSYITFTQPQAGFTMQVPADWSQQTTVLSDEIIQAYPNGFDAAYVNSCEEAAYVAAWNIPGQSANFSVLLIRPSAFDFDLFDAEAMIAYLGLDPSLYEISLADEETLSQEKEEIRTLPFAGTLTPKDPKAGDRCAAWRVIDSQRGAYIFTADWTYGDTQAPEIFETMLRSFSVL